MKRIALALCLLACTAKPKAATDASSNGSDNTDDSTMMNGGADTAPPTVTSVDPADGTTNVAITSAVKATLSETLTGDATGISFTLEPSVNGTVNYDANAATVTFTPSA